MKVRRDRSFWSDKAAGSSLCLLALLLLLPGCLSKKVRPQEPLQETRSNIISAALVLQGKPYRNGARGPDAFDCSGFIHYVYKKARIVLPVTTDDLGKMGVDIPRGSVLPGDLVFFKIKRDLHVGLLLNQREFIHASKSRGVAIDDLTVPYWTKNLRGFRSFF
jgi:cell wall-associated NlpC family hydrolase